MEFISFLTSYVIPFLVVLTILVFVHEMGHFLLARWNGVKVEVFSVGFGTELWGFTDKHDTRWRLSAVPLGGYVKMFGEGDVITGVDDTEERPMTEAEKKVSFHHKRLGQRSAIVAAGPAANFLFAIVVLWAMNAVIGVPKVIPVVGEIIPETAAEDAGFQPGDVITAVDGQPIDLFQELSDIVSVSTGRELTFTVERAGNTLTLRATPRPWEEAEGVEEFEREDESSDDANEGAYDEEDLPRGLLGVRPDVAAMPTERTGVVEGLLLGVEQAWTMTARILGGLGDIFSGDRSAKELGGVIMIAEVTGDAAQSGALALLWFVAILSINLGLINLFPVPVLDGGHLVFYAAEAVRGRPLSAQVQEYGFRFGLVLVLLLMLFATWNDFERLFEKIGLS